ncbi:unnamed protein product [Rotaria sordida]|uniref:Uncharacterized protein n=1 Tax=Rotaria sordida TaxID=392033 RepID=A0A814EPB7_9BILA|nr:unnamed protein product [Rotaria sordida]CAF0972119.1 unnamed protein product [Rotaria sordida]CAF0976653.1 unnamed protein product [Rotaria sordida]CAF1130925.1 unnamed protein product [Rotaria sordida]
MKVPKVLKHSRRVHIIRVSKPEVRRTPLDERVDTRILSSVDSWLSSIPSAKEQKVKEIPKNVINQPLPTKNNQPLPTKNNQPLPSKNNQPLPTNNNQPLFYLFYRKDSFPRVWVIVGITIFGFVLVGSIVGIILGIILR